MKWLRWLPRLLTPGSPPVSAPGHTAGNIAVPDGQEAVRPVGTCESCGSAIAARTRSTTFRGRVDCACGHRNHVEYRVVRTPEGDVPRHVTVSRRRKFESTVHDPDLRLGFRYGLCEHCAYAVRLLDAHVISHADSTGSIETFAYYCPTCHVHDDFRRGQLLGHDGDHVVDKVRFQVPPGLF